MSALLEIQGLNKSYGKVKALTGVDLEVGRQCIFGLVGPNGAGKTTLFSIISGSTKADSGSIRFDGEPLSFAKLPSTGALTILPQDAQFAARVPIGRQLTYFGRLIGLSSEQASSEAHRVLQLVGLSDVYDRHPSTLSHGMLKRVGIAQAFLGDPKLIMLDEPTAGLDPHAAYEVRALIRSLQGGKTIVVSSHNLAEIEDLCDSVAIRSVGQVVEQQTLSQVLGEADELFVRLSLSPKPGLLDALASLSGFTGATYDKSTDRLRVSFDVAVIDSGRATKALVDHLVNEGVPFVELQVGKGLEQRFLERTARR